MKSTNSLISIALAVTAFLSLPSLAHADGHVGNGGGSWTCRSNSADDTLIWVQLVDLSEARREFNQPVPVTGDMPAGAIPDPRAWLAAGDRYLSWAESKIKTANPNFYAEYLRRKADLLANRIFVPADSDFDHTSDILHHTRPDDSTCVNGHIMQEPEQLANFTDMGHLEINGKLWYDHSLSEIDRAALFVHEIVYWIFRDFSHDTDSLRTRVIVGYLFSSTMPIPQYAPMISLQAAAEGTPALPLSYGMFAEITGHWVDMDVESYDVNTQILTIAQKDRDAHWTVRSRSTFKCVPHGSELACNMVGSTKGKPAEWADRYIRIMDPTDFMWVKIKPNGSVHHVTHYSKVL
jgi:hypothetical protein